MDSKEYDPSRILTPEGRALLEKKLNIAAHEIYNGGTAVIVCPDDQLEETLYSGTNPVLRQLIEEEQRLAKPAHENEINLALLDLSKVTDDASFETVVKTFYSGLNTKYQKRPGSFTHDPQGGLDFDYPGCVVVIKGLDQVDKNINVPREMINLVHKAPWALLTKIPKAETLMNSVHSTIKAELLNGQRTPVIAPLIHQRT